MRGPEIAEKKKETREEEKSAREIERKEEERAKRKKTQATKAVLGQTHLYTAECERFKALTAQCFPCSSLHRTLSPAALHSSLTASEVNSQRGYTNKKHCV